MAYEFYSKPCPAFFLVPALIRRLPFDQEEKQ
jgi:hypothetical protein